MARVLLSFVGGDRLWVDFGEAGLGLTKQQGYLYRTLLNVSPSLIFSARSRLSYLCVVGWEMNFTGFYRLDREPLNWEHSTRSLCCGGGSVDSGGIVAYWVLVPLLTRLQV